ncbi:MAG: DUF4395 domain-containing protein [Ignavibacteriales bacterium]|nr:MAG: DUF4395 domain-containing protein [Ignavibacteriales bacterium]
MSSIFKFGEDVEGYNIPVLNEREVRAAAGLLFVMMFVAISTAAIKQDFSLLKYSIIIFLLDFIIRVFVNPKYSPTLILGRLIVRNQVPEYVGAPQKKFAWAIGFSLGAIMFVHLIVVNAYSPITGIICFICLVFLFFETSFGICLGCKFYPLFFKEKVQLCPGEVCDIKAKQEIQKTSAAQVVIVLVFVAYIFVSAFLFKDNFSKQPYDLFGIDNPERSELQKQN